MSVEQRLIAIEERNSEVEIDKAWETSYTRKAIITIITYVCGCIVFKYVIGADEWTIGAIVPVMGYILSTLGLSWIRKSWEKKLK